MRCTKIKIEICKNFNFSVIKDFSAIKKENFVWVCNGENKNTKMAEFTSAAISSAQRLLDTYAEFVVKLADVYTDSKPLERAVFENGKLLALPDEARTAQVVRLAMRWVRMVDAAPLAFEQHNDTILTTNSVLSVLFDLGVNELVSGTDAKRQTFKAVREAFWAYVDKLTKQSRALTALVPNMSDATLEASARLNNQLSQMDLPMVHDQFGNTGVNLAQVCSPNHIGKTAEVLANVMRKGNVDSGVINSVVGLLNAAAAGGANPAAAKDPHAATNRRQRMRAKLDAAKPLSMATANDDKEK